jgi:hypothetical protein
MSHFSREAILTVLSGLSVLGCDKAATVKAEPAASTQVAPPAAPADVAAPAAAAASAAGVNAKEVPSAQGKASEKEKTCSPGGCAPGQCGGSKK